MSQRIRNYSDLPKLLPANPKNWTLLVLAAGQGSRLDYDGPKLTFPIQGKPIFHWQLAIAEPSFANFVYVVSPQYQTVIKDALTPVLKDRFQLAIQESPSGMADGVAIGLNQVRTPYICILWGDQLIWGDNVFSRLSDFLESDPTHEGLLPTMRRKDPYIHIARRNDGKIVRLYEKREGHPLPDEGESDVGLFFFKTQPLKSLLQRHLSSSKLVGKVTGERNFLPLFPIMDGALSLCSIRLDIPLHVYGINSREDAERIEGVA